MAKAPFFGPELLLKKIFHFPVRFPLPDSALLGEMNHRHRKAKQ
jgi:hypothetical protein